MYYMYSFLCILSIIGVRTAMTVDSASDEGKELMAVVVIYRHGDRSPSESFPSDQYFDLKHWPMGFKQLTNLGKMRLYNLGKWFRQRYSTFLPLKYSNEDIHVYSTESDRTLMSAYTNLAGLYPPVHDQIWNENLLWQPIPVRTMPFKEAFYYKELESCALYDKLLDEVRNNDFFKDINVKFADLYGYLSEKTGMQVQDVSDIRMIRSIFYAYQNYNSSFIPLWAGTLNQTAIDYLASLAYQRESYTLRLKRLGIGIFFNDLHSYIHNAVEGVIGTPKFLMFSGHDTSLTSILNAMDLSDLYPVGFGDTIIWEIKREKIIKFS